MSPRPGPLDRQFPALILSRHVGVIVDWRADRGLSSYLYSPTCGFALIPPLELRGQPSVLALDYSFLPDFQEDSHIVYGMDVFQKPCDWMATGRFVQFNGYVDDGGCLHAFCLGEVCVDEQAMQSMGVMSAPITRRLAPLEFRIRGFAMSTCECRGKPVRLLWNDAFGRISLRDGAFADVDNFDVVECTASFASRADRLRDDVPWDASDASWESPTMVRDEKFVCKALRTSEGWKFQIHDKKDKRNVMLVHPDRSVVYACFDDFEFDNPECVDLAHSFRVTWIGQVACGSRFNRALLVTPIGEDGDPLEEKHHPIYHEGVLVSDGYKDPPWLTSPVELHPSFPRSESSARTSPVLTVINRTGKEPYYAPRSHQARGLHQVGQAAGHHGLPTDIRYKKTRAMRRALTKHEASIKFGKVNLIRCKQTSEVAAATAETVKSKFNDMRNSSLFKSFESKLGTAYTSANMTASTSIDKLSGAARGPSAASTPANEQAPPMP